MKNVISICFAIYVIAAGCNREEPSINTTAPPDIPTLQPIAQYSIAPHVAEPSGIVYHHKNNSFLVVSDSHPEIFEIDFQGHLLRSITTGSTDLEGISLSSGNDTIYIVEERVKTVVAYRADGTKISSFIADIASLSNNGLEGITVGTNGNLYVLNEKLPGLLLEFTPGGTEVKRAPLTFATDYSGIFYDKSENCLWIISDESRSVTKTDLNGDLISQWSVPFQKGEGISIVRDTMYIVNDADATMYVFLKP